MAASFLLSECLEKVFLNLIFENPSGNNCNYTSTKGLYSCTLVSRHWCRISTPLLYAYPFHHFRHLAYPNIFSKITYSSYFKLIRTLLSCVPKSEIKQLTPIMNFSVPDILATFNYITFIRGLIFDKILFNQDELFYYQKMWLTTYVPNDDNTKEDQFSKISVPMINHLVKFLCKHCKNLTTLEFLFTIQNNEVFNDMFESLTTKSSNLKELYYVNENDEFRCSSKDLYLALSDNVCGLNLLYNKRINSAEEANSLSHFISLQKKLQHIILSERVMRLFSSNIDENYNIVFNSLSTQSENLQILEFKNLSFTRINEKALISLCLLKNIRELKLYKCKGITNYLQYWAKYLTKLETFEFDADEFTTISEGFLIQIIQSSSNTLTKLVIKIDGSDYQCTLLFEQISLHLNSLTHLVLPRICPGKLVPIFKMCTKLVYLSIETFFDVHVSQIENLKNLGTFIPKNLQRIRFEYKPFFNRAALRCFLEKCINSNSKLRFLEMNDCPTCFNCPIMRFGVAKKHVLFPLDHFFYDD